MNKTLFYTFYLLLFNFMNLKLLYLFIFTREWEDYVKGIFLLEELIGKPRYTGGLIFIVMPVILLAVNRYFYHNKLTNPARFYIKYWAYYLGVVVLCFCFAYFIQNPVIINYLHPHYNFKTKEWVVWANYPFMVYYHILIGSIASLLIYNRLLKAETERV